MNYSQKLTGAAAAALLISTALPLHAQLGIGGVADKGLYYDQATFTITNDAGYAYDARLDQKPVPVGSSVTLKTVDYHALSVTRTNLTTLEVTNRLVRFIISATERNGSEDGLPPWTPHVVVPSAPDEYEGVAVRLLTPGAFPAGFEVPVVAFLVDSQGRPARLNGILDAAGQASFKIYRGVGSGFLPATNAAGLLACSAEVAGVKATNSIVIEDNTVWTPVSGTLPGSTTWPANSRIQVVGHLTNVAGSTLTVGEGSIVRVNPAIDIYNSGQIVINGTTTNAVVFMPATPGQPWGGFIQHASNAGFSATGAIFTGSGANQGCWFTGHGCSSSLSGIGSHRAEQALISLKGANCNLTLVDSAAVYLAGQFSHSAGSVSGSYKITLTRFLMQRCTTGGEYTDASFSVNDSAFIECPDASSDFVDGDNDGLYIVNGTHGFTNSLWGWTKDDGIDSGGSGAGVLNYQGCWFESTFHEGNSLSGTGKIANHRGTVFMDCGQGLEAGYDGPTGNMYGCLATANLVGGRFGDNYAWSYSGFLRATNSILINNYHDVWGMNWQDWTYRTSAMDVQSNAFSAPNPMHPNNSVFAADVDGARLNLFRGTSAGKPVGVGLAIRSTQFAFEALTNSLPVRLSCFSSDAVSLDYRVEAAGQTLASGTLVFSPGETLKSITPLPTLPAGADLVRVQLSAADGARVTGVSTVWFSRNAAVANTVLVPAGSRWKYLDTGENAGTAWRLPQYDDTSWSSGLAELGYGDGGEATPIRYGTNSSNKYITYYFRHSFVVTNPESWGILTVRLKRDDGGIVYLKGTEIFRSNITNAIVDYLTRAVLASDDGTIFYSTNAPASLLVPGTNVLAVEIHQESGTSSDISFDLSLEASPRPQLNMVSFGQDLLLTWADPAAQLESADNMAGPWFTVTSASPVPMDRTASQKFYRLRRSAF